MKTKNRVMKSSVVALAVQGALLAMYALPASADDEEAAALKNPTNQVEVGVANVSQSAAKFGEYNGMKKSGGVAVGNFSVRGGDAYGGNSGTQTWSLAGSDLGTTSRAVTGSVGNQGKWSVSIGYDQLQHNFSNTYQTPYQGTMGGNNFMLPAGFGLANNVTGLAPSGTNALSAAQLGTFQPMDVSTARKNGTLSAGINLNEHWNIKLDFNHLVQSGARLSSFGSMGVGGATGEVISILPNPTNYRTDNVNLALNWAGEQAHVTTSYFGSFFRDGYNSVAFQTYAGANNTQLMSTAPNNDFHQLNLNGGYALSSATKLAGGLSYGRNTQNDAYAVDAFSMVAPSPTASLNGLVRNTHADLKLTNQTTRDLTLSAGAKFDERNNRTASNFYYFNALDGAANHQAYFPNTPYSNRKTQIELAGDYRIDADQHVRLAYVRENIKRWCDQYAVGGLGAYPVPPAVQTGVSTYPAGVGCVVAPASKDDKLSLNYRLRASEDVNLTLGYSFSKRNTTSDPNAITARIGLNGNPNLAAPATSLIMGINAGDFLGFYPVFDASRKEQMLKAGMNWQAAERLSVGVNGKYTYDKYDSLYGVQNGNSWSLNLDTAYEYGEGSLVSMYLTQQHRQRQLTDLQRSLTQTTTAATANAIAIPPGATWTDHLKDDDTTVGIGGKQGGLMKSRLEITEDLTYSLGRTGYSTQLNYATTTTGGLTCSAPQILSCGDLPTIRSRMIQFKLIGKYRLDKNSKFTMGYVFQQLKSNDYYYNGLQYGYTPNSLMPTNQVAPTYTVNVVAVSYTREF